MKIKRIKITNYRGIAELDADVPASGAVARGRNGSGKTTILRAIKAALLAQDVSADAIRKGADKAEILVDLDDHTVKRVVTEKGQRLEVTRDGMSPRKPQTYLTDLLGTSSLDPLDLLTLKGKERRARVLASLPVTVTREQLTAWDPTLPVGFDCGGHGLEVIATRRATVYAARTEANRALKEAEQTSRLATERARALATSAPDTPPDVNAARRTCDEVKGALGRLQARDEQSRAQAKATEAQRRRVVELREKAARARTGAVVVQESALVEAEAEVEKRETAVKELRASLAAAEQVARDARAVRDRVARELDDYHETLRRADAMVDQAGELEATLDRAAVEPVSPEAIVEALALVDRANEALAAAILEEQAIEAAHEAGEAAQGAEQALVDARDRARNLDVIVKALDAAPAELLSACDGIPGLTLDGDDVLLDGVRLDALCGSEQVRFCVEIARRANAKSKILVVDGLERLDPEQLDVFVGEATRDGYQLLATRVDRGDIVLEAIEPERTEAAA